VRPDSTNVGKKRRFSIKKRWFPLKKNEQLSLGWLLQKLRLQPNVLSIFSAVFKHLLLSSDVMQMNF
jgi:hypothetical protein